jgi:hypothetical protein
MAVMALAAKPELEPAELPVEFPELVPPELVLPAPELLPLDELTPELELPELEPLELPAVPLLENLFVGSLSQLVRCRLQPSVEL